MLLELLRSHLWEWAERYSWKHR